MSVRSAQAPHSWRLLPKRATAIAIVGAAAVTIAALPSSSSRASTIGRGTVVRVTERDFHISAPRRVATGDITLVVRNDGPDTHELIVVRAEGRRLPLRPDGLTVDEEGLQARTAASLDGGAPQSVRQLHVHLPSGRYVLFCNMAGHYLGGMHTDLVVR